VFSEHGIFYMESANVMLTDTKLRNLKPKEKLYKVNDRDGLYVAVTAGGQSRFATTTPSTADRRPSRSVATV
jgi:hypothetical protein